MVASTLSSLLSSPSTAIIIIPPTCISKSGGLN
jgi:hypothetical protein